MKKASEEYVKKCKSMSTEQSIEELIDRLIVNSPYENNKQVSRGDMKQFVESIGNKLENWVKKQTGHPSAVRFVPDELAIAFNLYLQSPAAMRQMEEDSCMVMPTESQFQKLKQELFVRGGQSFDMHVAQPTLRGDADAKVEAKVELVSDGKCEGIAVSYKGWRPDVGDEWVQLATDEMKLSEGLVTNCKNNVSSGLTKDFYDLGRVMKNFMQSDDEEPNDKPATYVNQWWVRSTSGRVHNAMAFFNSGNLSADVVLRQLLISIFASEVVGSKVYHLVCDAGGSYGKLFTYLRQKRKFHMM